MDDSDIEQLMRDVQAVQYSSACTIMKLCVPYLLLPMSWFLLSFFVLLIQYCKSRVNSTSRLAVFYSIFAKTTMLYFVPFDNVPCS